MSNLKRKGAPGGHPPSKSAKASRAARPTGKDAAKSSHQPRSQDPVVLLPQKSEPIFPRGGGSVLTPLEQKNIQLEAKADALREDEFDTGDRAPQKKRRTSVKAGAPPSRDAGDSVRVETLNFKKLVKGSLVLGQVSRINSLDVEIALPYNLTGYVPIVAVSDQLTARLRDRAVPGPADSDDASDDESDVDLESIFAVGQYLRVYVESTGQEAVAGKGKRRIELLLRPAQANSGLGKHDVTPCCTVMASVVSVEDRGCVMDMGIADLRAFLPTGDVDPAIDYGRLQPGAVFLCHVAAKRPGDRVAQLSLLQEKLGGLAVPSDATTISTYLPGTAVSLLISHVDRRGLAGKVMGHLDVTADLVHSGTGPDGVDLESAYKVGTKVKARIICNFPTAQEPKLGVSLLPHVLSLSRKRLGSDLGKLPTAVLPVSSLVEECAVRIAEAEIGLFVDTPVAGMRGFVHISRVKDGKVDSLYESSGPYKVGSVHRGRVVGYSELDGLFHLSLQKSTLEQQYIRLEDVPVGGVVDGVVEKLIINEDGVGGLIVKIADGIAGLVTERHMADVRLQHPEKKFREGLKVKARILSTDLAKKQMRLTLKKTLVNSEAPVIQSFDQVSIGMHMPGTIVKLQENGAHIQFYGSLRGFLPVSEMSEAYIRQPADHFRVGQVVSVHVLDVDPEQRRLVVSCKDPSAFGLDKQKALRSLRVGDLVSAKVVQKTEDQVFVEMEGSQLKAMLPVGHLTDKSASKNNFALKRISTGQTLSGLMVIDKNEKRRAIILTQKPSLVQASKEGRVLCDFAQVQMDAVLPAFVRNVTPTGVFVQLAGSLQALLPKSRLPPEAQSRPDFGMQRYDSIEVRVISLVQDLQRIAVAPSSASPSEADRTQGGKPAGKGAPPADGLTSGSVARVRITSVKQTQLNVQLVDGEAQGRIDVSQVFDVWDAIVDPKNPLGPFRKNQQLRAKVIGIHNAKDHRFLPISHRSAHSVLELTAKPGDLAAETPEPLSLDAVRVGDSHVAFVNNVGPQCLWVNLSPSVRGRISAMESSDDLSQVNELEANFPIGSALKVKVLSVDVAKNRLDLSARTSVSSEAVTWSALKPNMILPGRVTKVTERQVLVKLSESVAGPVHLPDMVDNYDDVDTRAHKKNDFVRAAIVEVDASNKRIRLSLRPSRVMSSTLPVQDAEISSFGQLSAGDVVRGFVKNVSDKGLFVLLGGQVTALVKISNLSDGFLKEWKDQFQVDQLVKGRVVSVDGAARQVELSLKASVVDENYVPPTTLGDLKEGQVVTGKVRKVEEYGAFIVVDDSANVSGLCHRSQMADETVMDATRLYKEGDAVKALVLGVDVEKRRVSFGLKPSLFADQDTDMDSDGGASLRSDEEENEEEDEDMDDDEGAVTILGTDKMQVSGESDDDGGGGDDDDDDDDEKLAAPTKRTAGLGVGKKSAWSADAFAESGSESEEQGGAEETKKRRRRKAEMEVDKTGELDAHGPQTASDYERLLLGHPDSSELWIAYMALQMQVSELAKAREVAERAIKAINIREETEKLNVWVAYLNLEVTYGSRQRVEEVFARACGCNDEQEVHERLASIYIQSSKLKEADGLLEATVKKFGATSPQVWTNYGHFLHATLDEPGRARALLGRATQQLDRRHHAGVMSRFAALEFRSAHGEAERGRTMFEGLLATWPKRGDLWSQLVDLETGAAGAEATAVRDVFERRLRVKGLKPRQAERWFRRWAAWEETVEGGDRERVMAKAQDWAAAYKAGKASGTAAATGGDDNEGAEAQ